MSVRQLAVPLVLIALGGLLWGQTVSAPESAQGPEPRPIALKRVGTATSETQFSFGFYNPPNCDGDGNIYFRVYRTLSMEKNPIVKVSPKAEQLAEFSLPADYKDFLGGPFAIDPDGNFNQVAYDGKELLVLKFASDGRFSSRSKLDVPSPEDFLPSTLAVFRSGEILLGGHFSSTAPLRLRNLSHVAIYHPDGRLLTKVATKLANGKSEDPIDWKAAPSDYIAMAADGYAYNLRGHGILVISPSGEVVRTINLHSPNRDYTASKIDISGGTISVLFRLAEKDRHVSFHLVTYDLTTGELSAEYVPDADLGKAPLCFSADEGYTFFGHSGDKLQILRGWVK